MEFIELMRASPSGGRLRREILYLRPGQWWIVDSDVSSDAAEKRDFEVHFTVDPRLDVSATQDGRVFELKSGADTVGRIRAGGCAGGMARLYRGAQEPFLGWSAATGRIEPAYAIHRQCPAGSASLVVVESLAGQLPVKAEVTMSRLPSGWMGSTNGVAVTRDGEQIEIDRPSRGSHPGRLSLQAVEVYRESKQAIDDAYERVAAKYPRYVEGWRAWRVKVSFAIFSAFAIQCVLSLGIWLLSRRFANLRWAVNAFATAAAIGWISVAAWLYGIYFA
jgi:hypothetical protein